MSKYLNSMDTAHAQIISIYQSQITIKKQEIVYTYIDKTHRACRDSNVETRYILRFTPKYNKSKR
jgi:hypothetical protein